MMMWKKHFFTKDNDGIYVVPICGKKSIILYTYKKKEVTCKACLSRMKKRNKQTPEEEQIMEKELAEKVYLFILERINGWSEDQFAELSPSEIYSDPIFEDLCKLQNG